jgi:hypothetical protein
MIFLTIRAQFPSDQWRQTVQSRAVALLPTSQQYGDVVRLGVHTGYRESYQKIFHAPWCARAGNVASSK